MFVPFVSSSRTTSAHGLVYAAAALLLAVPSALAGGPAYGVPSGTMPWEQPGFRGYHESQRVPPPPSTSYPTAVPMKYTLRYLVLPQRVQDVADPNIVVVMAHLPEDALVWIEDAATTSKGMVRYYESPPLQPGKKYQYTIRVAWHEDGRWVSKTTGVPVQAGQIHCFYLTRPDGDGAEVAANLAKLSPEDRQLAREQKTCVVQSGNPLGSMGVPVKLMVKGEPVFLCCEGCRKKALAAPEQTLARARELKGKAGESREK